MIKNHTFAIVLFLFQNIYSQSFEDNIKYISTEICNCSEEINSELNDKLLSDCFSKVYYKNKMVMNNLIKEISKKHRNTSELEKKGIIANLIDQSLGLHCNIIGKYISKKAFNSNNSQLLNEISNKICAEINQNFKSSSSMNYGNVDPIIIKYYSNYYSDIKKEYDKKGKKIDDFGKDLVAVLLRNCQLYRQWTIRLNSKN